MAAATVAATAEVTVVVMVVATVAATAAATAHAPAPRALAELRLASFGDKAGEQAGLAALEALLAGKLVRLGWLARLAG